MVLFWRMFSLICCLMWVMLLVVIFLSYFWSGMLLMGEFVMVLMIVVGIVLKERVIGVVFWSMEIFYLVLVLERFFMFFLSFIWMCLVIVVCIWCILVRRFLMWVFEVLVRFDCSRVISLVLFWVSSLVDFCVFFWEKCSSLIWWCMVVLRIFLLVVLGIICYLGWVG